MTWAIWITGAVGLERKRAPRWSPVPWANGVPPPATPTAPERLLGYEPALSPELVIHTDVRDVGTSVQDVMRLAYRLEHAASRPAAAEGDIPMRVQDLMSPAPVTVDARTPVLDARQQMVERRIRHLLVLDSGRLVGIVTDRDIRLNLPSPATSLSVWEINYLLARLTVGDVMSKSLIVVEPEREAREAARIMLDHKIGALPVVDGDRLLGIVTESDFLRAFVSAPVEAGAPLVPSA